ncbi:HAD family hydrolase [Staphylococcus shinii]|uniref:HAD family hydrolase n=2 Tax=Staphylococcus shinii TaxID=2912228 RepID=UPI000C32688B|nr:HAD-IA family hydrolase [Staphylococcus shinii]PKI09749.1 HAD family hydrolase [Staphylococcus shinii]
MIKAILFDLDGTILDRETSLKNFIDVQYDKFSNYLKHIEKITFKNKFIELDQNGYVWKDKVYTQLIDYFNISHLMPNIFLNDYTTNFWKHCLPYPNLYKTLKLLTENNYKLAIITNGKFPFQYNNIKALKVDKYMEVILVSEKEEVKKPNPLIFERAAKKLGVKLNECIFVGDSLENDYKASKSAGMYAIYKSNKNQNSINIIPTIKDLFEIPCIINNYN